MYIVLMTTLGILDELGLQAACAQKVAGLSRAALIEDMSNDVEESGWSVRKYATSATIR
jgi:hypothetical protein